MLSPLSLRARSLAALRRLTRAGYAAPRGRRVAVAACERIRRHFARRSRLVTVEDFDGDLTLEVDLADHVGSYLFWAGSYSPSELAVLDALLAADHVFVDVGANIGVFTLFAAKRVPRGRVYAFEPLPALHARLARHVADNRLGNVETVAAALSDAPGETAMYLPDHRHADGTFNDSMATLFDGGDADRAWRRDQRVPLVTLDDFSSSRDLGRVDVIKLDIEGGELPALRGARCTIARHRPALVVEANDAACRRAGYRAADLIEYLRGELGYRLEVIAAGGALEPLPEPLRPLQNLLATPA